MKRRARKVWAMPAALGLLLAALAGAGVARAQDEPAFAEREALALSKPLSLRWAFETNDTVNLTPALGDGAVYLPLVGGALVSLRTGDGRLVWKTDMGGAISAAPAADARGVYVASESVLPGGEAAAAPRVAGALRALGSQSGVTLWMRTLTAPLRGALVADERALYGGAEDGRLYALKKETGELLWVSQFPAPFQSRPVLRDGRLYVGGEDGTLHAVDRATGRTLWRYRTRKALRAPVALDGDMVFAGST
ncbi:MAG TPA: PQQ-binding-like beta-propeller repeat protein, partial [Pyrinomonadaceae bacterium]|nr:PQQ-binding-like beta-propeller repeat protein [Pyrinomonadaceae bacterium]